MNQKSVDTILQKVERGEITVETIQHRIAVYQKALAILQREKMVKRIQVAFSLLIAFGLSDCCIGSIPGPFVLLQIGILVFSLYCPDAFLDFFDFLGFLN